MPFKKGEKRAPTAGRKKGVKNKTSQFVKDAILAAFDQKAFIEWAQANPVEYYTKMVTRCLPKEIMTEFTIPQTVYIEHRLRDDGKKPESDE